MSHWSDMNHECDRHGVNVPGDDSFGEDMMTDQFNALCAKHGVESASDDVSGAWLCPALVRDGCAVEMKFFRDRGVYECVPRSEQRETGGKIIGTKWIDVSKGDFDSPRIRCRLVGKKFRTGPDDALYVSSPPLKGLRIVFSRAATVEVGRSE